MPSLDQPAIFLITGHPRSGTTLVTEVLSRHPDVYIPPETHFFTNPAARSELSRPSLARDKRGGIERYLARNERLMGEIEQVGGVDAFLHHVELLPLEGATDVFLAMMRWFAIRQDCRFIGEKTPDHITFAPHLLTVVPELHVVDVVRDPRDVALSHRSVPWGEANASFMALRWWRALQRAERARHALGERFLQMRYEDFVGEPERRTQELCAFLELPFTNSLLTQSESRTYDVAAEPWKAQASQPISATRVGRWRQDLEADAVWRIETVLQHDLRGLDYPLSQPSLAPPLRWAHLAGAWLETSAIGLRRRWRGARATLVHRRQQGAADISP